MGLLGFVRDAQKTGFGGAISKEAKRLGVMPSGSSTKMLGTLKDTVQGVNSALGPMGPRNCRRVLMRRIRLGTHYREPIVWRRELFGVMWDLW